MDHQVTRQYEHIDELEKKRLTADAGAREEIDRELVSLREQIAAIVGNPAGGSEQW